ncbi:mechanosensitive ion channel family protein [Chitinilyticum aquatile]|uniref:mechanosensitive ion channel family protein n=1 Tax=Chitinilyticum aquatile TaxID=362520 RepID=UPI000409A307|nr:mechanosensitive ion channel family protein [Chitinilyticum aquatile]
MWLTQFADRPWPMLLGTGCLLLFVLWWRLPAERGQLRLTALLAVIGLLAFSLGETPVARAYGHAGLLVAEILRVLLGMLYLRLCGMLLFRVLLPLLHFRPLRILEDMTLMLAYAGWGMLRLREGGLDLSQLVTTSAVITAVIAFSMQDTLGNILSGIALQADQSLHIGQWVKAGDYSGKVVQIGWRSTQLETRSGETVVIPNGWLMKNTFVVLGRQVGEQSVWRRNVVFELDWRIPAARVIALTEQALADTQIEGVATEPAPSTVLMQLQDGVAQYVTRYWLTRFHADDLTDSQVRAHLLAALGRNGIVLAAREHRTQLERLQRSGIGSEELARRLEALANVSLFDCLSAEEREQVARELVFAAFEAGDVITRQGAVAHWLYILTEGRASVWLNYGQVDAVQLGVLNAGEIFGEMGMMTGAPRTATVIAASYAECYRLDHRGFEEIIATRPELAESMSKVLAQRQQANRQRASQDNGSSNGNGHLELLARVRHFFGLS